MSAEHRGYSVIGSLDPLHEGDLFVHPVHLKLVPWFMTDEPEDMVDSVLDDAITGITPFKIIGQGEIGLSSNGNHRARLVGEQAFLSDLHTDLLEHVDRVQPRFDKPYYTGTEYVPHITPQVNGVRWIRRGQVVTINELQLVSADPNRKKSASVVRTFPLGTQL